MSEQIEELEFEMSDDLKLEELGYPPELYELFQNEFPEKATLNKKDNASNDYFMCFMKYVTYREQLEAIDVNSLTAKQTELLADKLLLFAAVKKIEGKEVEAELEDPYVEMWASEDRIVAIHKDSVDAIHVDPETKEEHHATYNRGDPCYMCDREFGCGQTAGCPVCDGLMTAEEFDKHFGSETVELEAGETVDILIATNQKTVSIEDYKKAQTLLGRYINKNAELIAEIADLKKKCILEHKEAENQWVDATSAKDDNEKCYVKIRALEDAVRELATIFKTAKLGKVKVSTETIAVLKEVGGK